MNMILMFAFNSQCNYYFVVCCLLDETHFVFFGPSEIYRIHFTFYIYFLCWCGHDSTDKLDRVHNFWLNWLNWCVWIRISITINKQMTIVVQSFIYVCAQTDGVYWRWLNGILILTKPPQRIKDMEGKKTNLD